MNGQSAFGWLKVLLVLGALAAVAFILYRLKQKLPDAIKSVALAPSRAADSAVTALTGREETLGGWLAEIFNPATRAVSREYVSGVAAVTSGAQSLSARTVKPVFRAETPADDYSLMVP
jgi:hypothetical protein